MSVSAFEHWIPPNAVVAGTDPELGEGALSVVYVARATLENGGTYRGEANYNQAWIPHEDKVTQLKKDYEVFTCPDPDRRLKWVEVDGEFTLDILHYPPILGGKDKDGKTLYIVKAEFDGGIHCGYTSEGEIGTVVHGEKVKQVDHYSVLYPYLLG
ncbi:uncharacterized protein FOMMEDRAFT_160266 [Fomitiporia mediterranea MF3/22]|uniref:uncharacterized protein n=1 Tax=Fomitiporia mediterranea (strain MF3/22) TaxID=694068 RepID=UPI0004409B47|nr:uncharacterized protein FOMMEDRAFT_160266 [Fomitiporia mediterranea MF3/22]EJC99822.1 hypothetical protein FOMMEDRAFT_160266 [Fomitiporia mediterranea MF3/22]